MTKLDVKAFGIAVGVVWGVSVFILGIAAMLSGWGGEFVQFLAKMYYGYQPTILGSLIGAIYGFIDAGIGGIILAWLYNKLAK